MEKEYIFLLFIFLIAIILYFVRSSSENFKNVEEQLKTYPLFVNYMDNDMSKDFALSNSIRKFRMFFRGQPTLGEYFKHDNYDRPPIIIIPTIGASKIFAKWNRNSSEYVKTLDSSGNFETTEKWKCKDVQAQWTQVWPSSNKGLSEYCWTDLIKTNVVDGKVVNQPGVITTVHSMGMLDLPLCYDSLITSLKSIGYVTGVTLFGANYDFRKFTTDAPRFYRELSDLINSFDRPCIIIGHGFGSCIANSFLVNSPQEWKDAKVSKFYSISGTFGGVPKALRTVLSGDQLENSKEKELLKNASANWDVLQAMVPSSSLYGTVPLMYLNRVAYNSDTFEQQTDIPKDLLERFREDCIQFHKVPVHFINGTGMPTDSAYVYTNLSEDPVRISKEYSGDGTVPDFVFKNIYDKWSQQNSQVFATTYYGAEHTDILKMYEPTMNIINYIINL